MQTQPPTPDDDEAEASTSDQAIDDSARTSSSFSATRASRIRRNGPRISGAIPGRAPLPGSESPTPTPASSRPASAPIRRPSGPRTSAHLMAGLCYLLPPVAPAVILFSPLAHRFARFHALQAIALFVAGATLSFLLSLFTPTNIILSILYFLLVLALIALLLLWMAAAIGSFEGFAVPLPLLDRIIPRADDLEEGPNMRGTNPRSALELGIAAGGSALLLILTVWLPLAGGFGKLTSKNLAAIGLNSGLPIWMIVSSLLFSLIFAAIGLTALAVLILGLRKGKFLPSLASGAAVVGSALVATGTGMLIADMLQRSLYSKLVQQFQDMVSAKPLPNTGPDGDIFLQAIRSGREAIQAMDPTQHSLLIPGAVLLVLGLGVMLFLLSQLYYKK